MMASLAEAEPRVAMTTSRETARACGFASNR